jgi:hypothetical protein
MINDLITRASGEVAKQSAGTTTRVVNQGAIGKGDAGTLSKTLAALQGAAQAKKMANPIVKALGSKYGVKSVDDIGEKLLGMLTGDAGGFSSGMSVSSPEVAGAGGWSSLSIAPSGQDISGNSLADYGISDLFASLGTSDSVDMDALSSWISSPSSGTDLSDADIAGFLEGADSFSVGDVSASSPSAASADNYGSYIKIAQYIDQPKKIGDIFDFSDGDWKDDISDVTDAVSVALPPAALVRPALSLAEGSTNSAISALTDPGQWAQNIFSGDDPFINASFDLASGAVQSVVSTADMAGRAVETVSNAAGDVIEGVQDAIGWIICTELNKQHRLPNKFYVHGAKVFATYKDHHKKGYYVWAIPTVKHLRKHPYSLYSKFICSLFNWRAEYLASQAGCRHAKKTLKGWAVTKLSYYFCVSLSYLVPEQSWKELYATK